MRVIGQPAWAVSFFVGRFKNGHHQPRVGNIGNGGRE